MTEVDKQKFRNDQEFYEIVRTFHELVTEINKSFNKTKKYHHQRKNINSDHQEQQVKKIKTIQKKPLPFEFRRNQYHMRIAYKIFYTNSAKEHTIQNIENFNPIWQSMKITKTQSSINLKNSKRVQIIEQEKKDQI